MADEKKSIKRLVVVPDVEKYGLRVREILGRAEGRISRWWPWNLRPGEDSVRGRSSSYSLMNALGIREGTKFAIKREQTEPLFQSAEREQSLIQIKIKKAGFFLLLGKDDLHPIHI